MALFRWFIIRRLRGEPLRTSLTIAGIALGVAVVALAWFGIRTGQKWALWTAFIAPVIALVISLPLHYVYGLDTLGHLGPIYLDVILLIAGTVISYNALQA